jgi:50S ribosomal protein L16 3-hydroxylase
MEPSQTLTLLGGLSPQQFMRRHWQKKPLLVREAIPGFKPLLNRAELFALAGQPHVESRLIRQGVKGWGMKSGPFGPRSLPSLATAAWTLLVQGVDLHDARAHALLQQFRFVPDARLDDLMISYASEGGGVGPHFDSYDVFLLQASGRRRWRIGQQTDLSLQEDVPLKILQNFKPTEEFVLEAGDMLYLPPRYAHDGVAQASLDAQGKPEACMTYSVGFRAPAQTELAGALLQRLAEYCQDEDLDDDVPRPSVSQRRPSLYRDPQQAATSHPAAMPEALNAFAHQAVTAALKDPLALACALGEYLTEPKASVWFDPAESQGDAGVSRTAGLALNARTRMLYDAHHIFINGESYRAKGADASLMQRLADARCLTAAEWRRASPDAKALLADWQAAGWLAPADAE